MKRIWISLLLAALPLPGQTGTQPAQGAARDANEHYRTPADREGIAKNLSSASRLQEVQPERLVNSLSLKPGNTVADVGTGVGMMLPYLGKAVGPAGKVLAEDIFPDFLEKARAHVAGKGVENVQFIQGTEKNANLPEDGVDLALTVDAYHHFNYPAEMLASIRKALRPDGRFVIVDFHRSPKAMPNGDAMHHIRIDTPDVIKEVESNGFKLQEQKEHVPESQYILIFVKASK